MFPVNKNMFFLQYIYFLVDGTFIYPHASDPSVINITFSYQIVFLASETAKFDIICLWIVLPQIVMSLLLLMLLNMCTFILGSIA